VGRGTDFAAFPCSGPREAAPGEREEDVKEWIHRLGSLKIAVALLVLIMTAMAVGTVIESTRSSETALQTVYYARWFRLLLLLFAANVACSLIAHWPWGWQRAGFLLTHVSILLVLAGALVTDKAKIEGRLALWEGDTSNTFVESLPVGVRGHPRSLPLPFSVRLEAFEIDTYPGTERPAMFRSRVLVTDEKTGQSFPAVIEMNRELSYAGYRLFQTSYQRTSERDQTILTVSRDPGQWIVFAGYILLTAGMITVLGTRIAQHRAAAGNDRGAKGKRSRRVAAALGGIIVLAAIGAPYRAAELPSAATAEKLRGLPVQHDGRVMPLDTLAREAVWNVTGGSGGSGSDPVAQVIGWTLDPDGWAHRPIVRVGSAALAAEIGLSAGTRHASYFDLVRNRRLAELMRQARSLAERDQPVQGLLRDAQRLENRLFWVQGFLQQEALRVTPPPGDPNGRWSPPGHLHDTSRLEAVLEEWPAGTAVTKEAIDRELTYNRVRPSRLSWWILTAATAASVLAWSLRRRWIDVLALVGLIAGFAVMTWGLAVRWQIAGRIPASNMYESLLFLAWGVALFALIAVVFVRNRLVIFNATAMSALTMVLADCLPVDPFVHPMAPVLSGTAWLAIHVPIIMVSYSVLALGVLVAHMQIGLEIFAPARRDLVDRMADLLYWYIHIGSILLIAGILTGSIWAASSWGRYWGWDPKEVWSLIAFVAYLAILHGRFDRLIGPFGVAMVSIGAFWTIIMTYVGVNYVLATGLHSYGFGGSGVVGWLLVVAAFETLFLGTGLTAYLARKQAPAKDVAPA
jgi:cytochrome c-type biogenesis protein CcsB